MLDWIKRAWAYSRTIFLNAVSLLTAAGAEIISYLLGLDWASVISNPRYLLYFVAGLNILNIVLRIRTTAPVGQK